VLSVCLTTYFCLSVPFLWRCWYKGPRCSQFLSSNLIFSRLVELFMLEIAARKAFVCTAQYKLRINADIFYVHAASDVQTYYPWRQDAENCTGLK
jgi:hypothetical protein